MSKFWTDIDDMDIIDRIDSSVPGSGMFWVWLGWLMEETWGPGFSLSKQIPETTARLWNAGVERRIDRCQRIRDSF